MNGSKLWLYIIRDSILGNMRDRVLLNLEPACRLPKDIQLATAGTECQTKWVFDPLWHDSYDSEPEPHPCEFA